MAFDSQTRNKLQRMVGACRRLLAEEFDEQLQGLYGIYAAEGKVLDIDKLPDLDDNRYQTAALLRDRIEHLRSGIGSEKQALAEAVRRVLREQAFTLLNRSAALRMAEERGFVQESIGQGLTSKGFQVFETVAGAALGGAYERYGVYIRGMFDELALDLGVLFDRWSPFGLLFPREPALLKFFDLLNDPELKPLWKEDETIGWIYQYFNDEAERKKMREESAAPRNSRELAVRNQFFTPRYVVEFLTDNTLGRIWYEMTKGQTRLKDQCRYLVRRPNEIFLAESEELPNQEPTAQQPELSQEELLKQPVHIPHRPIKDPREIRLLDPACGSMHFGLYAFDLFTVIYEEAWEHPIIGKVLQEEFKSLDIYRLHIPRLIIEHNIHGIDIDPRAVQIAGLSLWLRAQRSWHEAGIKLADRPRITRANIVCAEPMPGEKALLREFVEQQFPAAERPAFTFLLEKIFDRMTLAGEAGSLLRIDEEIRDAIAEARKLAHSQAKSIQKHLFPGQEQPEQVELDFRKVNDEQFWQQAELRIYNALKTFAEQAESGGYQRRLFSEDAAEGFAFIDICRKHYDVVVMNPPFGAPSPNLRPYLEDKYHISKKDLYAAFVDRFFTSDNECALGAISSRTGFFIQSLAEWRMKLLPHLQTFADFGLGVLDGAMVETAAYVMRNAGSYSSSIFSVIDADDRENVLSDIVSRYVSGERRSGCWLCDNTQFLSVPGATLAYWLSPSARQIFIANEAFEGNLGDVRVGLQTNDNYRFVKLWYEVPPRRLGATLAETHHENENDSRGWIAYAKGGEVSFFFRNIDTVVNWFENGREMKAWEHAREARGQPTQGNNALREFPYYFRPGITWAVRSARFTPYVMPSGSIFSATGYGLFPYINPTGILGFLASNSCDYLLRAMVERAGHPKYIVGIVKQLPVPADISSQLVALESLGKRGWSLARRKWAADETCRLFECVFPQGITINKLRDLYCNSALLVQQQTQGVDEVIKNLDNICDSLYGSDLSKQPPPNLHASLTDSTVEDEEGDSVGEDETAPQNERDYACALLSYFWGVAIGRWDIRYAIGEQALPELPDPFAPLPVCSPGQLQNAQGLPARSEDVPAAYPVRIPWDGILLDDPNHPLDLERRIRVVIEIIWKDRAEAIEQEACEILGVKSLRDYFLKPAGFFAEHLKRYSKSRRQAPIYWPLSTASGSYTLWLYYHRLNDQTLFQCVNDFVKPKLEEVDRDIERLQKSEGKDQKAAREALETLQDLAVELKEFRDELLRVAGLPYKPNLNDGVLIAASPLWKLFRLPKWQKDLKACWDSLEAGKYDWAHLAYTIWPDRVREGSKKDRSIAIAHGLEDLCEVKAPEKKPKKTRKKKSDNQMTMEDSP